MLDIFQNLFLSKLTLLFIDAVAIYLAILVYRDGKKKKVNIIYLAMTLMMMMWVNYAYIPRYISQSNPDFSLFLLKVAWFATPLLFSLLYYLTVHLVGKQKEYRIVSRIVILSGALAGLVSLFSNKVVAGLEYVDGIVSIIYGPWMLPFLGVVALSIIATLIAIFTGNSLSKPRTQHFLVGVLIFYVANSIFNIFLPIYMNEARFYFLGDYSTIILLFFTAYGILKYKFFNIKTITTEVLVVAIWAVLASELLGPGGLSEKKLEIAVFALSIVLGVLLIKSVRTEIKHKEELEILTQDLEKANVKLKAMDETKSEFISIASHQLRTPLSGIKGYLSMLLEGDFGKVEKEQNRIIQGVFNTTERLVRMVNIFLNISRIEQGRLKLISEVFDIGDLIKGAVGEMSFEAEKKGVKVIYTNPDQKLLVNADKDKLKDVVLNFTDNAVKYTEKGTVEITGQKTRGKVRVAVKDSGIGISKSEQGKLFNKFVRAKKKKELNTSGAGLGLFVVKRIVELHKGKVWAESPGEGKGSSFIFEIPTGNIDKK